MLVTTTALLVALAPAAAARGRHGCGSVVARVGSRRFVGYRFEAVHGVSCKVARVLTRHFLAEGHSPTACENGCRVAYRWLCFYEGYHDRYGYEHDCFGYPQYPAVGFPVHPGPGFFFAESVQ